MNRTSFGALVRRHRLAFSLVGIVAACAVILPACGGGGDVFGPQTGTLTIVNDAQPDDAQDFAFSTTGTGMSNFSLDDDPSDGTLPNSKTFTLAVGGPYTVAEGAVSGWSVTSVSCTQTGQSGSTYTYSPSSVSVTLVLGGNVTCTFLDAKPVPTGTITLVKDAQPNDAQDFTFTSDQSNIAPFPLDDDSDPTLSNQRVFAGLPAGSYTFTESAVSGWNLTSLACTPSLGTSTSVTTRAATIVLVGGDNITCTWTNTKVAATGSITIVKDAQPNDAQDFSFTSNQSSIAPFALDDDSDPTLSNQKVFSGLTAGFYTFTETAVSGWTLSNLICTPAGGTSGSITTATANIQLAAGDNVICTFTNTRPTGTLTVVKDAQPDDAQDFHFATTGGGGLVDFDLDDDGNGSNALSNSKTFTLPAGGPYTVTEAAVSGWAVTGGINCTQTGAQNSNVTGNVPSITVTIGAGGNVICTFVNRPVVTTGTITIVKDAQPNDAQDFAFTSNQSSIAPFSLDDDSDPTLSNQQVFTGLTAGNYTFAETAVSGWTLTGIVCTPSAGTSQNPAVPGVTIALTAGANVVCTFTNTQVPTTGTITIVKDAQPNSAQDFAFTSNQPIIAPFSLDDDSDPTLSNQKVFSGLPAGSYTFAETSVSGWNLASIVCTPSAGTSQSPMTPGVTIALVAGANVTCTFTNVQQTGTLTIVKDAQPDNAQDFHFSTVGAGLSAFDLDDDPTDATLPNSKTFTGLAAGVNFTVTEGAVSPWTVPSLQCLVAVPGTTTTFTDQLNRTFTVNLAPGANVTCTFINTRP